MNELQSKKLVEISNHEASLKEWEKRFLTHLSQTWSDDSESALDHWRSDILDQIYSRFEPKDSLSQQAAF